MAQALHLKLTASGLVYTGSCRLRGFLVGMDGANDPTITIYDNTEASGDETIPTNTYDSSLLGLNGVSFPGDGIHCIKGIYCGITLGAGAVEVVIYYSPKHGM